VAAKKHKPKKKKKAVHKRKPANLLSLYQINITDSHGATDVHPKKQPISIPKKDEVVWKASGQSVWTVTFNGPNGSPFDGSVFSNKPGYPTHSGPVTRGVPDTDYKYTAQIDNATPEDPIIHTDP
jgi:hypothetical protein